MKLFNFFRKSNSSKLVQKEIISVYVSKQGYIIASFSDGTKARFFRKYTSKLLKGNVIEFLAHSKGNWLNPAKEPKLRVIKQAPFELIPGNLQINYVSRFMEDEMGEYVYLPKCLFIGETGKKLKGPALIYIDKVGLENERVGVFQGYGTIEGTFAKLGSVLSVEEI